MNFTFSSLAAGFLFGVIGIWLIKKGRRETNLNFTLTGAMLLIYPFFSPNAYADWGIGFALCAFAYLRRDRY